MSRIEQSMKNTAASLVIQVGTILLNFVSRTIFIRILGEQYLGINGLFGNILNMLSLAELGIGTTITYWLYEPMAKNDQQRLNTLMSVYAKIYNFLGIVILLAGLSITPFLEFFMKEVPDIPHIALIYMLYVLKMSLSYFFVYKSTLIDVAQKAYVTNIVNFISYIITTVVQIVILFATKNYILYFSCAIVFSFSANLIKSKIAEKMFPFLKTPAKEKLTATEKVEIKKDVSAIFSHNIGTFVLTSTDNLVIAKIIGVIEVGIYSNYTMILNSIQKLLNLIFGSLINSVGNLIYSASKERTYEVFKNIFFAVSWIVGFCSICLYTLLNPFITLWLGERYVFHHYVVLFIVINFFLTFIRQPVNNFKHCAGLFRKDKYKPYVESAINLFVSIWLAKRYGIVGVFMGTTVSTVVACMYIEPYILYKYFYEKNVLEYFGMFFKYLLVIILAAAVIVVCSLPIQKVSIVSFLYQMLLCMTVPNLFFYGFFRKTPEMQYFLELGKKMINRMKVKFGR